MATATPDFFAIKQRQQLTWATGNYAVIGSTLQVVPELLVHAMNLRSGANVLDVAAGNGNASLAAARRWCRVTSTDYVPELLEIGKARAAADGFHIDFAVADAEDLPYPDGTFDAALSTFGVMFTPQQERSASELFRVVRPGGTIGLASWTPTSFVGRIFGLIGRYVPPPAALRPPSLWGTANRLHELFPAAATIATSTLTVDFCYLSPQHWLDVFRTYYGPMNRTFAALDSSGKAALTADLMSLMAELNRSTDETLVLPAEYLQAVITR